MKLIQVISSYLNLSRRETAKLIKSGVVELNGEQVLSFGCEIDLRKDRLLLSGVPIRANPEDFSRKSYIAYHKPPGLIVTSERMTAIYHKIGSPNLRYAGRLDGQSRGLLILSDDGNFLQRITHPSYKIQKRYILTLDSRPKDDQLTFLEHAFNEGFTPAAQSTLTQPGIAFEVCLSEGKNRQIRRICAQAGLTVKTLIRIAIGSVHLGKLEEGSWRCLTKNEVDSFR